MKTKPIGDLFKVLCDNLSATELRMIMILSDISYEIQSRRCKSGMSFKEFAKYMDITTNQLEDYENGEYDFTLSELCYVCNKLHMDFNISFEDD